MAISASSISHAVQTVTHRHNDRPSAPLQRRPTFQQQLAQAGVKNGGNGSSGKQPTTSGGLLSTDLLQAVQTIR